MRTRVLVAAVCTAGLIQGNGGVLFEDGFESAAWAAQAGGSLPTSGNSVTTDPILSDTDPYAGAAYEADEGPNGVHGETLAGTAWQWIQGSSNLGDSPEELVLWNDSHAGAVPAGTMNGTRYIGFNRKVGLMLNLTALGLESGTETLNVTFDYAWGDDARGTGLHYAVLDGAVDPSWDNGVNLYNEFGNHDLAGSYAELTATDGAAASGTITLSNLDVSAATGDVYFALMSDLWNNRVAAIDNITITDGPGDTTPPAAPVGLVAMKGDNEAFLDWTANWDPDLAGYNVYRSDESGGPYTLIASNVNVSACADSTAANGAVYHYVVEAVDTSGNTSAPGNESAADNRVAPSLADPPNILLIFADDLGYADVGYHAGGSSDVVTPNIDTIAQTGVQFRAGYVTCNICGPSRAGLLTGRYQNRFGFENNMSDYQASAAVEQGIPSSEYTLAELLRSIGYTTGMIGKWHTGKKLDLEPNANGFDEFFGFNNGAANYRTDTSRGYDINLGGMRRNELIHEGIYQYLTNEYGDQAAGFIDRHADEPFFLYLAFNAIHGPMQASDEHSQILFGKENSELTTREKAISMLYSMDLAVGAALDALERNGLANNTLVIFLSDNGGTGPGGGNESYNDPLRGQKTQMWEGGIRIPFCMKWPAELAAGRTVDYPVIALDVLPTVISAAGSTLGHEVDGIDLLPYLRGEASGEPHDTLCWRRGGNWAVRNSDWKLVYQGGGPYLYNISGDLSETNDLAAVETGIRDQLQASYDSWEAEMSPRLWGGGLPYNINDGPQNKAHRPASIQEWIQANAWLTGDDLLLDADPDGDGHDNFFEYASGCAPDDAADRPVDLLALTGGIPTLRYTRLTGTDATPFPLTYSVEFSEQLSAGTWSEASLTPIGSPVTNHNGRTVEQSWQATDPVGERGFYRMKVSSP